MKRSREHATLLGQIRRLAEPGYRSGSLRVAPTGQRVYGVRTPDLRRLARSWRREHGEASPDRVLALAESLWNGASREERCLGLEILRLYPEVLRELDRSLFDRWRRDVDNWGVCDFLGGGILGPWLLAGPGERLAYLDELIRDEQMWSRRLALVATVWLNRKSDEHADLTLSLVDRVLDERDPMIAKAVSWALRELIGRHRDRVAAYLEERGDRLASLPRRETRNKLETGRKSGRA